MLKLFPTLTALALVVAAQLSAAPEDVLPRHGDDISKFRDAGAWVVRQNMTSGTCFAAYQADSGAIVQFGFVEDESAGYLGLFSPNVATPAANQEVAFIANGNIYAGIATGVAATIDGFNGAYVVVNNRDFARDIAQGEELVVFPETPEAYVVDMSGASTAAYEVRKCTAEISE